MSTQTVIIVALIIVLITNVWIVRTQTQAFSERRRTVFTVLAVVVIVGLAAAGWFARYSN